MARSYTNLLTWMAGEFAPRILATPEASVKQMFENAIRYWNSHSGYKISTVVNYTPGTARVQVGAAFKTVVDVMPTSQAEQIWNNHPLWTLTGVTILDNVTTDLILMSEAFRNYQIYVGTNFRFHFEKSDLPTAGGYLYCVNVPAGTASLYVVGTKRILPDEDVSILPEVIVNWIYYYTKALVKQLEGHTLRATDIIDVKSDGQELYDEGKEEVEKLQETIKKEAWWVMFLKRM
jgi:hypothetical protein